MRTSSSKGHLQDWITQLWVRLSGRTRIAAELHWLQGPTGSVETIADEYLNTIARDENLVIARKADTAGLLPDIGVLGLSEADLQRLAPAVADFYTHTGQYEMDVWHAWHGLWRTGYQLLAWLYSRRLRQLNLPIHALDAAFGLDSEIAQLRTTDSETRYTIWFRTIRRTGRVIYSGSYGCATPPRLGRQCLKVAFPLPNGNATVLLNPEVTPTGGLMLISRGRRFGDAGFYFTVKRPGNKLAANYIRPLHETIHVYVHTDGELRTDHTFSLWGSRFLHLHYRMRRKAQV